MSEGPVALVPKAGGGAGGGRRRVVGPSRAPFGLFIAREARFAVHKAPKATITPFKTREQTSSSRNQAERRWHCTQTGRFLSPRLAGLEALPRRRWPRGQRRWLEFAGCWVRNPASVFAVLGEVLPLFLAISGYFWVGCVPRWAGLKINYFARHR